VNNGWNKMEICLSLSFICIKLIFHPQITKSTKDLQHPVPLWVIIDIQQYDPNCSQPLSNMCRTETYRKQLYQKPIIHEEEKHTTGICIICVHGQRRILHSKISTSNHHTNAWLQLFNNVLSHRQIMWILSAVTCVLGQWKVYFGYSEKWLYDNKWVEFCNELIQSFLLWWVFYHAIFSMWSSFISLRLTTTDNTGSDVLICIMFISNVLFHSILQLAY
jgi:hypothetical protein